LVARFELGQHAQGRRAPGVTPAEWRAGELSVSIEVKTARLARGRGCVDPSQEQDRVRCQQFVEQFHIGHGRIAGRQPHDLGRAVASQLPLLPQG
jgi:hypothetical protein